MSVVHVWAKGLGRVKGPGGARTWRWRSWCGREFDDEDADDPPTKFADPQTGTCLGCLRRLLESAEWTIEAEEKVRAAAKAAIEAERERRSPRG